MFFVRGMLGFNFGLNRGICVDHELKRSAFHCDSHRPSDVIELRGLMLIPKNRFKVAITTGDTFERGLMNLGSVFHLCLRFLAAGERVFPISCSLTNAGLGLFLLLRELDLLALDFVQGFQVRKV